MIMDPAPEEPAANARGQSETLTVAPRLILMITKQIEGIPIFLFEKVFVLFRGKIIILPKL